MGVFYNSICVSGDRREEVQGSLRRWLHGRGFELSDQPMLFDLDGEAERSAFVIWNELWTILVFSKYEEERRLIRELQSWAPAILYLWVQDSDVWGYDVFDGRGFAGSFNSDPRSYRSFYDDESDRPVADPADVCRRLELSIPPPALTLAQRRKAIFKEDACLELCRLIGAEAAAASYDDLERGTVDLTGWHSQQLLFFHRDWVSSPACGTDLHRVHLVELSPGAFPGVWATITPELMAEMEQMRRRAHLRVQLLKPVSGLARAWRWGLERAASLAGAPEPRPEDGPATPTPRVNDSRELAAGDGPREISNRRHQCQITLAPVASALPVSGRPAAVCAFRVGETSVTCTSRRLWKIADVMRPPSASEVVADDAYHTLSGLDARHLRFQLAPHFRTDTSDPSFLGLHVVATPIALYVFLYRFVNRLAPEVDEAIRTTAESFRLSEPEDDEPAQPSAGGR